MMLNVPSPAGGEVRIFGIACKRDTLSIGRAPLKWLDETHARDTGALREFWHRPPISLNNACRLTALAHFGGLWQ